MRRKVVRNVVGVCVAVMGVACTGDPPTAVGHSTAAIIGDPPPITIAVDKERGFVIRPPIAEGTSVVLRKDQGYNGSKHKDFSGGPQDDHALDLVSLDANGSAQTFDVYPVAPGVVEYAGEVTGTAYGGYGNIVFIRHQNGYWSLYAHLATIEGYISAGVPVDVSSRLGTAGQSGNPQQSEIHLHLAIYKGDVTLHSTEHYPSGGQSVVPEPVGQCTMLRQDASNTNIVTMGLPCAALDDTAYNYRFFKERSAPAAIEDSNGQLYVFVKGADGQLYYKARDCASGDWLAGSAPGAGQGSAPWTQLPAAVSWTHVPALVRDADGYINVFMRGNDGQIYHNVQFDSVAHQWSGWHVVGSTQVRSLGAPSAILDNSADPARLSVFIRGAGNELYVTGFAATGTSNPTPEPWTQPVDSATNQPVGDLLNHPVAVQSGTYLPKVYLQKNDYLLYSARQNVSGRWTDPVQVTALGSGQTVGEIGVTTRISSSGPVYPVDEVAARTVDDVLIKLHPGTGEAPNTSVLRLTHNPAAVVENGAMVVLSRQTGTNEGSDGVPLYIATGANGWDTGDWTQVPGLLFHGDMAVIRVIGTRTAETALFGWESAWIRDPKNSTELYYANTAGNPVNLKEPVAGTIAGTQPSCSPLTPPDLALETPTVEPQPTATPQGSGTQMSPDPTLSTRLAWDYQGSPKVEPVGTKVFWDRTPARSKDLVLELIGTVLSVQPQTFRHSGLQPETEYCYRVQSYLTPTNLSNYSRARCVTTLAAPTGLSLAMVSTTEVRLTWQDNSANEDRYQVQRRRKGDSTWEDVARVGRNSESSLADYVSGVSDCYRVYAANRDGSSLPSNEVCTGRNRVLLATGTGTPDSGDVAAALKMQLPGFLFTQIAGEPGAADLANADILVSILPNTSSQLAAVKSFVSGGGSLLLIGEWGAYMNQYAPAVPTWAGTFGFSLGAGGLLSGCGINSYVTVTNNALGVPVGSRVYVAATNTVSGGTPVLTTSQGQAVFTVGGYGQGRVAVSGDSNIWATCGYDNAAFTRGLFGWLGDGVAGAQVTPAEVGPPRESVQRSSSQVSPHALHGTVIELEGRDRLQMRDGSDRRSDVVPTGSGKVCRLDAPDEVCGGP